MWRHATREGLSPTDLCRLQRSEAAAERVCGYDVAKAADERGRPPPLRLKKRSEERSDGNGGDQSPEWSDRIQVQLLIKKDFRVEVTLFGPVVYVTVLASREKAAASLLQGAWAEGGRYRQSPSGGVGGGGRAVCGTHEGGLEPDRPTPAATERGRSQAGL